ncbi:uroporphyrinogen-III C-methyltransferase [Pokkaliibacter sp. CJK22405]|uniref:uroporphyrinogen-III C-methyltransferase n=1 Tax=Pokkaliibacter sp. CJK22405 TaxID=3384615 RepID=UPI0039851E81
MMLLENTFSALLQRTSFHRLGQLTGISAMLRLIQGGKSHRQDLQSVKQAEEPVAKSARPGHVMLIGTGPGAMDLLTVRAYRLICEAKVVIYDRLVGDDILDLIPADAERYYVGKKPGQHSATQDEINALMIDLATRHPQVLRLKGGDPAIFARLAEERDALNGAGISWSIVPGITAASGCAASVGIPLTDRASAHSVRYITATHYRQDIAHDWAELAREDQTLVFYMGVENASQISRELVAHGLPADWPALIVERGTQPGQRSLRLSLGDLPQQIAKHQVKSPALLIIGKVVEAAQTDVLALELADSFEVAA